MNGIEARGFARKNDDGRNADRRLANRRLQPLGHLTAVRNLTLRWWRVPTPGHVDRSREGVIVRDLIRAGRIALRSTIAGQDAGVHKGTAHKAGTIQTSWKNCDHQRNTVIDPDAQRRALDAVLATRQANANANASAAAETRELLREDINRLQKEVLITSSIAAEVFFALLASDPERAWHVSESVLLQHEKYRNDSRFPNIRDLLSTFSRVS
jgi:hypothetical protein